ncbi:MAG: hypothetical protein IRZ14_03240 [Chloroflexi bacterium]|nr:hypothetical protein [Chloroflexota bacterium]
MKRFCSRLPLGSASRGLSSPRRRASPRLPLLAALVSGGLVAAGCSTVDFWLRSAPGLEPVAPIDGSAPEGQVVSSATPAPSPTATPMVLPTSGPSPVLSAATEPPELSAASSLSPPEVLALFVEQAPLPAEARLVARTLRPTFTVEYAATGYWLVRAGSFGEWRVWEETGIIEPADGTAELWELQYRWELR